MKIFNREDVKKKRQYLRNNSTFAETQLWEELRRSKIVGVKFRRQHSVNKYVLDFYAPEIKLAIELDGEVHLSEEKINSDKIRTEFLRALGLKTIRFKNQDVIENIGLVIEKIRAEILSIKTFR